MTDSSAAGPQPLRPPPHPKNSPSTLKLPEPIARLLIARGYADVASATKFLSPSLSHLHDPYAMRGMREAVERIRQALLAHEPILIYGDYDVDGTVATVLLKTACERTAAALGVTPDIRYHIPHRLREGYGMRESRIADAAAEGVRLVVSRRHRHPRPRSRRRGRPPRPRPDRHRPPPPRRDERHTARARRAES